MPRRELNWLTKTNKVNEMISLLDVEATTTDELEKLQGIVDTILRHRRKNEPMTYDRFISYKIDASSQKFSRYFEREWKTFMGFKTYGGSIYGTYDAEDKNGRTQESKYATYNEQRGASFPQIMQLDVVPDEYFITIFYGHDIEIYRVPGKDMHSSVIKKSATHAHANNPNQLRINIKLNSPEMNFLKLHRDISLEDKFKKHIFGAPIE